MKKAENSEKRPEIWRQVFMRMKNQDGASLMAALLFFVFCGVGASIILAFASASAGKIRHLPREDQKRLSLIHICSARMHSDSDRNMSALLTRITRQVSRTFDLNCFTGLY